MGIKVYLDRLKEQDEFYTGLLTEAFPEIEVIQCTNNLYHAAGTTCSTGPVEPGTQYLHVLHSGTNMTCKTCLKDYRNLADKLFRVVTIRRKSLEVKTILRDGEDRFQSIGLALLTVLYNLDDLIVPQEVHPLLRAYAASLRDICTDLAREYVSFSQEPRELVAVDTNALQFVSYSPENINCMGSVACTITVHELLHAKTWSITRLTARELASAVKHNKHFVYLPLSDIPTQSIVEEVAVYTKDGLTPEDAFSVAYSV